MIQSVARKVGIPKEKQVEYVEDYGNVGGATITFAMAGALGDRLVEGPMRLVLLGFGTGLSCSSWISTSMYQVGRPIVPTLMSSGMACAGTPHSVEP